MNAIRAFEAAARHGSFTKAAEELHVTQAAVSHHIKLLEQHLGAALFERRNNKIVLTAAGQLGVVGVRDGFVQIAAAMDRMGSWADGDTLRVTTTPSFAAKFLVPRLEGFRAAYPDIEMRIDASTQRVDLARENIDVGIRFGPGDYAGLTTELLFRVEVFPVCSPRLLRATHPLLTPDDLRWHTLLHSTGSDLDERWPNWRMWLLAANVQGVDWMRGPQFTESGVAIQAAIDGHGVLLGRDALVRDDIAKGYLVKPFDVHVTSRFAYYLISTPMARKRPKVIAFRDWLLKEVATPTRPSTTPPSSTRSRAP